MVSGFFNETERVGLEYKPVLLFNNDFMNVQQFYKKNTMKCQNIMKNTYNFPNASATMERERMEIQRG